MPVPEKYFTPLSALSFQDDQLVQRDRRRRAAIRLKAHIPRPVHRRQLCLHHLGQGPRCRLRRLAEHHKHRAPGSSAAAPWCGRRRSCMTRARFSGLRMPQLGGFPGHAEGRVHRLVAVVAVIDKIEVAIRQLAMDEQNRVSLLGFGVVEVRSNVASLSVHARQLLPRIDRSFADLCTPVPSPNSSSFSFLEFRLIVGQARVVRRLRPGNDRALPAPVYESRAAPAATYACCTDRAPAPGSSFRSAS